MTSFTRFKCVRACFTTLNGWEIYSYVLASASPITTARAWEIERNMESTTSRILEINPA